MNYFVVGSLLYRLWLWPPPEADIVWCWEGIQMDALKLSFAAQILPLFSAAF